jgi:hypothetical protein
MLPYLLFAAALAAPATSSPPPRQAPAIVSVVRLAPDAAQLAAAERLLQALHYDKIVDRTTDALVADAQKSFPDQLEQRLGKAVPKELKDKLFAAIASSMRGAMSNNRVEMRRGAALIYASRFTAAELDHLAELQKDPVLVKMQAELPGIAAESTALGRAAVERELPRMTANIEQAVKDYYASHGDDPGT